MRTRHGIVPGYNAQSMVPQIEVDDAASGMLITAVDVVTDPTDYGRFTPMLEQAEATTGTKGRLTLADAGYCSRRRPAPPGGCDGAGSGEGGGTPFPGRVRTGRRGRCQMTALEQARQHLETLGLKQAMEVLDHTLDAAASRRLPDPEMLAQLLGAEVIARGERYLKTKTSLAHLPFQRTLEQFDFGFQPSIDERLVRASSGGHRPGAQGHRERPRGLLRPSLRPDGRPPTARIMPRRATESPRTGGSALGGTGGRRPGKPGNAPQPGGGPSAAAEVVDGRGHGAGAPPARPPGQAPRRRPGRT